MADNHTKEVRSRNMSHLIMESEGMQLWIDDCFADMFR